MLKKMHLENVNHPSINMDRTVLVQISANKKTHIHIFYFKYKSCIYVLK